MSDDDDTTFECPIDDCPFAIDHDDVDGVAELRERFEQHVRWIHLPERRFGENPVPALTMLMMNGIIRPEEFSQVLGEVLAGEAQKPTASDPSEHRRAVRAVGALAIAAVSSVLAYFWFELFLFHILPRSAFVAIGVVLYPVVAGFTLYFARLFVRP